MGILAVQFGLITQQQLMECLDLQRGEMSAKSLEEILVARGLLTREAIEKLLQSFQQSAGLDPTPGVQRQRKPGTRPGRRDGTTSQKPRPGALRDAIPSEAKQRNRLMMGMLLAWLPLVGLGGYLIYGALRGPVDPEPPRQRPSTKPEPVVEIKPAADPAARLQVVLTPLTGDDDLVRRWNRLVERVNASRDPEQYKPMMEDLSRLVTDARKSAYESTFRAGYTELVKAVKQRAEQVFAFIRDDSKRLAEAGKFGEAIRTWDWFPGNLDPSRDYQRRIDELKSVTLETARRQYQNKRAFSETLAGQKKYDQAKSTMLEALEMGLTEFTEDAYGLVSKYTEAEDAVARAVEEAQLEEFTQKARSERELAQRLLAVRSQFWELVSTRKFDYVTPLLNRQKEGASPEVVAEIEQLSKAFGDVKLAFTAVETGLAARKGMETVVAFREGVKKLRIKDVERGQITYLIEGKEFKASTYEVAPAELERAAEDQKDGDRADLLRGVAHLLRDDFAKAHEALEKAGSEGRTLTAFVEKSSVFLEKNAPLYRERAEKYIEAKEWEKAVQEYSRLISIPSERKVALRGRARAYFNMGNFVATVLDVEQLFESGDYSEEVVRLLNDSYQRATLIAKAIQIYENARKKVPESGTVLENLVILYLQIHEYDKARQALEEAKRISGGIRLGQAIHLLRVASEPAFAGQVFRAKFGRYDLETNVSQQYANEMAKFMDNVYQEYRKVFPYKKNETLRFHVRIFASEAEFFGYYKHVTGSSPSGPYGKVLAYYMPTTKELVGWDAPDVRETMTHEGLHQYIDYFVEDCPIWFNEGYASYFEKSTADEPRFNRERHMTAQGLLMGGQLPRLKDLILMSGDDFRRYGAWHYGSSWALIFYLNKVGQKALLDRYFEELMTGKSHKQAFDAVFGKIDLVDLETRWRNAIKSEDYDK
ncbi:MAG: DUF1570 domain-containing protein [Planctomycetes bacterium]|nr:DUF1570 domain-containing protein [Planctomycetota bacterium]